MGNDLLKADTTWFSIFRTLVASGEVARMGPYAFSVYCVIKAHANFATGNAFPSIDTIVEMTGISRTKVKEEITHLVDLGYVLKGKFGKVNLYKLKERVGISDSVGNLQAMAEWEYRPNLMDTAIQEVKNTLATGDLSSGRVVNIEKMIVNVNSGSGTQINLNGNVLNSNDLLAIVAMLSEGELKDGMTALLTRVINRNT